MAITWASRTLPSWNFQLRWVTKKGTGPKGVPTSAKNTQRLSSEKPVGKGTGALRVIGQRDRTALPKCTPPPTSWATPKAASYFEGRPAAMSSAWERPSLQMTSCRPMMSGSRAAMPRWIIGSRSSQGPCRFQMFKVRTRMRSIAPR